MAIFMLRMSSVGRSSGRRATSAAAYRAGERIRDERSGRTFDHSDRQDVLHKQIVLPSSVLAAGEQAIGPTNSSLDWAKDRASLWNSAERAERRRNSRVAREYLVALPPELNHEQRQTLAQRFSHEVADRYNVAVDLTVHEPRADGDPRNHHAHLLTTTRELTPDGLGRKTGFDMRNAQRAQEGLLHSRQELTELRARWASLTNEALHDAGVEARVDHRTLVAQGIDREPKPSIPLVSLKIEQHGGRSEVAESIRARYAARVAERAAQQTQSIASPPEAVREASTQTAVMPPGTTQQATKQQEIARQGTALEQNKKPRSLEEIQRQARENWLKYRAVQAEKSATATSDAHRDQESAPAQRTQGRGRNGPDNDFGL